MIFTDHAQPVYLSCHRKQASKCCWHSMWPHVRTCRNMLSSADLLDILEAYARNMQCIPLWLGQRLLLAPFMHVYMHRARLLCATTALLYVHTTCGAARSPGYACSASPALLIRGGPIRLAWVICTMPEVGSLLLESAPCPYWLPPLSLSRLSQLAGGVTPDVSHVSLLGQTCLLYVCKHTCNLPGLYVPCKHCLLHVPA